MSFTFDTAKKPESELVLEKWVPLMIEDLDLIYFMTNDFTVIAEKIKSLGCRIPRPEDFRENPILSPVVKRKMTELNATWSLVITSKFAFLNFYDPKDGMPMIVSLLNLTDDGKISSINKIADCILRNDAEGIKPLVESGYDVEQCIESGVTPLILASAYDEADCVKILLELGADINRSDTKGQTPLMHASFNDSVNSVRQLLAHKDIKLEEKQITGETALLLAANFGSVKMLSLLIQAGADINAVDYAGNNALIHCITENQVSAAEILIDAGININFTDKMGRTALIVAAQYNSYIIADKLIKKGADLSIKDINKNTPFLVAAENNSVSTLELLAQTQTIPDTEYTQAVIKAAMKGHINSTNALLRRSKNPKQMAFAALTAACLKNIPDIIHVCMDYDCNPDDTLYFGMTPMMIACYVNADNAATHLIAYDTDINKADEDGVTALMYASCKNNQSIMTLLLRNGADKNAKDNNGKTFEDYTKELDTRSFSQLVLDRIKSRLPDVQQSRKDDIPQKHQSFMDRFEWYMQKYFERFPENKNSDIYNAAYISKQTFSKILSNRKPDYRPKKDTCIQLALGLRLSLNEAEDFLQSAGYSFSERDKKDLEIMNLLNKSNYNLFDWYNQINSVTGEVFIKEMINNEPDK